ncbi:MAG: ABC transporter ATP-binding protein [Gammaproteobacteria bacterium]|nr:MAG: ABC transporter ATP-binding protein [Gammaproteobacteria bacterium]
MTPLLEITDLDLRFDTEHGGVHAVDRLSLEVHESECIGIVGESGSGKTQTFLAALGLLAENGRATGSVRFRGEEILNAPRRRLDQLRGSRLAMIFQDALSALTPTMTIGGQLAEPLRRHQGLSRSAARARALEMLETVGLPDAARRLRAYPFELSGGQRQRVMIAMALICRPDLVIADEPTTALDVTVQAQVLRLLDGVKRHTRTSIVLITHDLAVVAGLCDRVAIMYAGRMVETGSADDIFLRPQHPYTQGLLRSMPALGDELERELPAIPGQPPDMRRLPPGCGFQPRCRLAVERCHREQPSLARFAPGHRCACHLVPSA